MDTLSNLYKFHKFTILSVVLAVLALASLAGCEIKGRVMTGEPAGTQPAKYQKMSEDEIAQYVAEMQRQFDLEAAAIRQQAAIASTLPAEEKAKEQAATQKRADDLGAEVDAFNKKIEGALAEIVKKRTQTNAVMEVLGGITRVALAGTFNPADLVGAGLSIGGTLLGLGALADSKSKSKQIKELKAKNPLKQAE